MIKKILSVGAILTLSGCVSLSPMTSAVESDSGLVTIYRSDELQGSVADTYIGWNREYYIVLTAAQYTTVRVPIGLQTFRIKAHADIPNELTITINEQQPTCLLAEVNPQNIVGLNWFVSGYRLLQVDCETVSQGQTFRYTDNKRLSDMDITTS